MSYSRHASDRAIERYNLILTPEDFQEICAACVDGRAPRMSADDRGNTIHLFTYREQCLVILLSAEHKIVSFMPPDYFTSRHKLKHRIKSHGAKLKPSVRAGALRRNDRRDPERRAIAESMEGLED